MFIDIVERELSIMYYLLDEKFLVFELSKMI